MAHHLARVCSPLMFLFKKCLLVGSSSSDPCENVRRGGRAPRGCLLHSPDKRTPGVSDSVRKGGLGAIQPAQSGLPRFMTRPCGSPA